jgi:hypothetical protein
VGSSHQRHSISRLVGTSPSYLRPPLSGAGTFLPQAGGQPLAPLAWGAGTNLGASGRESWELSLRYGVITEMISATG